MSAFLPIGCSLILPWIISSGLRTQFPSRSVFPIWSIQIQKSISLLKMQAKFKPLTLLLLFCWIFAKGNRTVGTQVYLKEGPGSFCVLSGLFRDSLGPEGCPLSSCRQKCRAAHLFTKECPSFEAGLGLGKSHCRTEKEASLAHQERISGSSRPSWLPPASAVWADPDSKLGVTGSPSNSDESTNTKGDKVCFLIYLCAHFPKSILIKMGKKYY